MRFLVIYYSFTHQAARVAAKIAEEAARQGGSALLCRVDFADPAQRREAPVPFAVIKAWGDMAKAGTRVPVVLNPAEIDLDSYDRVILLSNTWSFFPSAPIQGLLRSEIGQRLLGGRKVAVGIVCRGFFKKNRAMVRDLVQQDGGTVITDAVFSHAGSWLMSTIANVMGMTKAVPPRRIGPFRLPPFGVSPQSFAKVSDFVRRAGA